MVADQLGFDEGGVLQALSKPFYTRTEEQFEHDKHGNVTVKVTDTYSVAMSDVIAALTLTTGTAWLAMFVTDKDFREWWFNTFGAGAIINDEKVKQYFSGGLFDLIKQLAGKPGPPGWPKL